ncbi:hypothetical protein ACROYT_G003122 [Oculina patagonica]
MAPRFLFILFFLAAVCYQCKCAIGKRLGKFIKHHEPLYYDPSELHTIHRRAVESRSHGKFAFSAFGKFHQLNLRPDREIFTGDARILSGDGKPFPFDRNAVVRGKVEGHPGSDIYGVIDKDDGFHGKILSGSENYYVDPSSWYFDEKQDFPSVIYKDEDLDDQDFADVKQRVPSVPIPERTRRSRADQDRSRARRQTQAELRKSACTLGLYADNFFTKLYGSKTKAIFQLVKQVQAAQIIYTNQFNETNYFSPYGITFRVKSVVVFDETDDPLPNNLPAQVKDSNVGIDTLLDLFSSIDHSGVCEAFLFTDRDFEGGNLGLAWIGDPDGSAAGGICDKFADYGGGKKRSYNTGVVTLKLYGRLVPPRVSEITFAHELGHGFGSQHDPDTAQCSPGGAEGNYIMSDKATSGIKPNNDRFSICSKDSIKKNINRHRSKDNACFIRADEPICGNKIVERGEQCDCGDTETCTEDCCEPASADPSKPRVNQCKLKSGKICSPSQGPCCSTQCNYERPAILCAAATDCTFNRFCSGHSFSCNTPETKPNGTSCDGGRRLCYAGQCSTSVCYSYGLEECSCTAQEELCDLCCKEKGGECISAKRLSQLDDKVKSLKLVPGTPCDNLNGYCDAFAVCRRVDKDGPLLRLKKKSFTEHKFSTVESNKAGNKKVKHAALRNLFIFGLALSVLAREGAYF